MKSIKELMGLEEADKMKGEDPCWDNYEMIGTKPGKDGRPVPNCVLKKSKKAKSKNEEVELEEASDTKRPPNFTMHPIDRQDYKILRPPKKTPPKSGKEWGRDGGEKKIKEETEQIDEMDKSAPQPGRDGKVSHSTYGSRDRDDKDDYFKGKESLGKRVTAKQAEKDALKILNKQYAKEETEQIDELNKDTVYSYNKKADADVEKKHKSLGQLMRRGDAAGANKAAHQINRRLAGMERAEKRLNTEEVEQIDEISAEVKQKYLAAATKKHLQQFLGRAPVRDKQELDKRRAAIQKTSKELTGKTHYQEEVEVEESKKIPASDKPVDPKNLVVSLKDVPVKKPRGHTQYDPSKEFPGVKALKREETELEEAEAKKVNMTPQERAYKRKLGLKAVLKPVAEAAKVETAAQVTKHFEKGQSTPSGVPKWVAEPVDNPKLADKFMKAFRKMKTAANVSCKTYGTVSTCEETELDEAAKAKMKGDPSQAKNVKKGEPLSGKQEPVKLNPELQEK